MGAKIYDSASSSWKDADIPKVYSGSQWMDSEGMIYGNGAWKDAWGNKPDHFLIQNGVLVNELVGSTWIKRSGTDGITGSVTSGNGYLIVTHSSGGTANYQPIASKPIQASGYKYICVEASFTDQIGNAAVCIASSFGGSDLQYFGIARIYANESVDYQRYSAGAVSNGSTQGNYLMLSIYGTGKSFYVYNVKLSDDPTGYVVR